MPQNPRLVLLLLALAWYGAWGAFGAVIAQRVLRHKTSKPGFRTLSLLIAAVHGAILCGLGVVACAG